MLKLVLCSVLIAAVWAQTSECDCAAFETCVSGATKAGHEANRQCFDTCAANLDPAVFKAVSNCTIAKDDAKFSCVFQKTCTTKTEGDSEHGSTPGGKSKGKHGGKHSKGLHPLKMISPFLSGEQKASSKQFIECFVKNCGTKKEGHAAMKACTEQHPTCARDHSKLHEAAKECGVETPSLANECKCFAEQLGATDSSACEHS